MEGDITDKGLEILTAFSPLFEDLHDPATYPNKRPLLAHYTSIVTLERIMTTNEVWLSNPLFMNDIEELRFGIEQGIRLIWDNDKIRKACRSEIRYERLLEAFTFTYNELYKNKDEIDIYVFCLSKHKSDNNDGILSMWRGYGGNGSGAAIVIDTQQFEYVVTSPLILAQVNYLATEARLQWLRDKLTQFASLLDYINPPDDLLWVAAARLFDRIKVFSLLTKHCGFYEEKEWRVVYLKDRDFDKRLVRLCDYAVGNHGLEPKLKLPVGPIEGVTGSDHNLSKIIHKIILGPMITSPLVKATVQRMLEKAGKPELSDKVLVSSIPYRSL